MKPEEQTAAFAQREAENLRALSRQRTRVRESLGRTPCGCYEAFKLEQNGFGTGTRFGIVDRRTGRWISQNYGSHRGVRYALERL